MAKDKIIKKKVKNVEAEPQEEETQSGSGIWQDERFQHLIKDPRFKKLPKTERKVKIDKRFESMFTDDKFKVKYTVDKYGRRVNKSNAEDLRKYYELDGESSADETAEVEERHKEEKALLLEANEESGTSDVDVDAGGNGALTSDGEVKPKTLRQQLCDPNIDYARGEGRVVTDSSSDEETSEEEDDLVANIDHVWGELDINAETTEQSTRRLAVCNMDWDRIRSVDLMVLLSSFLPPGGSILSVKIFPSEYGKQRLAEEEHHGPPELVGLGKKETKLHKKKQNTSDSEEELVQAQDSDAEEGDEYHMEKLRQYQLNRLRYYYAVVECDRVETADKIYKECDGIEYESSAIHVDLRFIPDDTSFDEDVPRDVCNQLPDTSNYKPRQFTTTALQQVKVDLTWDETSVERKELGDKLSSGKLDEVNDKDLRTIVAYSSEEEEVEEKDVKEEAPNEEKNMPAIKKKKNTNTINKYKALLAEINEKEEAEKTKKYEMEFSWQVNDEKDEKKDEEIDEVKTNEKEELTPIEKILKKRSEKNKKRKDERKRRALQSKGIDPDAAGSNESDSDTIPDGVDMNDPYFAEEFANGDFVDTKKKPKQKAKNREEFEAEEKEKEKEVAELALLLDDVESTDKNHFSLEKILKSEQETKSKRKRRKQLKKSKSAFAEEKQVEDNFEVNVNDDRFKSIYSSHLFNIDPTDSHFKKTKGMEKLIQEKLKRRERNELDRQQEGGGTMPKRPKQQIELNLLVNSLKRKLKQQQQ